MGWLPQVKAPLRYDATWMQKLIESIRTALNFPVGVDGSFTSADGKTVTVEKGVITKIV